MSRSRIFSKLETRHAVVFPSGSMVQACYLVQTTDLYRSARILRHTHYCASTAHEGWSTFIGEDNHNNATRPDIH